VLREQNRRNTFLELMRSVASTRAGEDKAILHKIYDKAREK